MKVYIYVQYYIKIRPCFVPQNEQMKGKKVFFEDPQSVTSQSRMKYDGISFIITGNEYMIAIRALTDMQQIKKEEILPRLFSLFFS